MIKPVKYTAQTRASLVADASQKIECAGRTFVPDDDLAYVEFFMARSYPVVITNGTALHPQVVANSFKSLEGKVFNLCHLMKSNFPKEERDKVQDRILGYIAAVEFPGAPEDGWQLPATVEAAPEIRVVAAMFKAAYGVPAILDTWEKGENLFSKDPWTVSMENWSDPGEGGFLVRGDHEPLQCFLKQTPEAIHAQGFVYVPHMSAPEDLVGCLNTEEDDEADNSKELRMKRKYRGCETVFLVAGLNGVLRFSGAALTPVGKEHTARVTQMLASEPMIDISGEMDALMTAFNRFCKAVNKGPNAP